MPSSLPSGSIANGLVVAAGAAAVCAVLAAVYLVVSRGAARQGNAPPQGPTDKPAWPRRGHYLLMAVFLTAAAIYGSLVPLSYRPLELGEAVARFSRIPYLTLGVRLRADFMENLFLFIPISYCWLGVLAVDRRSRLGRSAAAVLVVLLGFALAVALEFTQLWFPPRTVSQNDILAESLGTLIGVGVWLAAGQASTDWVRSFTGSERLPDQVDWLLEAYLVGLLVYSLLPLDLVTSLAELEGKYRAGRIIVEPPTGADWSPVFFLGLVRDVAIFIPVGMLAATWRTPSGGPTRGIGRSVLLGGSVVLAVKTAQLFIYTRPVASVGLVTAVVGVLIGAWGMRRWRGRGLKTESPPAGSGSTRLAWLCLGLAGVYALVLFVVFCAPFELIDDPAQIGPRFGRMFSIPFAGLYRTIDLDAIADVAKKVLFSAPLGALLGLAVVPLSVRPTMRRILLAVLLLVAVGVGALIESAQVFLPPHVPEITDVILYTAGAAAGMLVATRLGSRRRADSLASTA